MQKGKRVVNPIIDWEDEDVWEYLKGRNIEYCKLYDKGFTRIGCVGCPLSSNMKKELELYPKFAEAYQRAIERFFIRYKARREEKGLPLFKENPEAMYKWWIEDEDIDYSDSFLDDY